ncbi:hypothetical protein BCT86_00265 [Vibrio breoganii]|uniref:hypothetical protein n=1 Tax=Vibrio breoganii TaxID=553239 RepID=UPI000C8318A3|nr:hypothetical protein [Vibrio breoganii]PML10434.1 hypothetical protein BCT86_00265 [Vibrio breoganii]PMM17520.1 hypothetical protein BCT59_14030 [Vibrio breoganii]PMO55334.1 hypothetical protein BCT07_15370 [Vibrio breoganii]PMO61556.1 hypothetical protein BCT04_17290 [Vibrio breoganii]
MKKLLLTLLLTTVVSAPVLANWYATEMNDGTYEAFSEHFSINEVLTGHMNKEMTIWMSLTHSSNEEANEGWKELCDSADSSVEVVRYNTRKVRVKFFCNDSSIGFQPMSVEGKKFVLNQFQTKNLVKVDMPDFASFTVNASNFNNAVKESNRLNIEDAPL